MPTPESRAPFAARIACAVLALLAAPLTASAAPASVTIAGTLQSEVGCSGDWQPDCAVTHLTYDADDDVWQGVWSLTAGFYEYKAALDDSWAENYGAYALRDGPNILFGLGVDAAVKFYYDHKSHWVTSSSNAVIATVPGSFQSEMGCGADWDPGCLRTWLQDPDNDFIYTLTTTAIPPGTYEAKVTINESWDENYGLGGAPGGPNIPFQVPVGANGVTFRYDAFTHVLTIVVDAPPPGGVASVTIAGSLQSEAGCPDDWQPDCAMTHLQYSIDDDVWQGTWPLPAGSYEYKAALNDSWAENYGANAQPGGANIPLDLVAGRPVKFYYDHKSHWVTHDAGGLIATVPGSFQSEIGCAGDWDPSCLRSWLQDPDGDGTYSFTTAAIPPGAYEAKVAINESWDENYGEGGVPGGPNIPFTVPADATGVTFSYDPGTHVLTITFAGATPVRTTTWGRLKAIYR